MVWAAAYKTKNKFAGGLVLWQSKGDTYGEHRMFKHLTVILAFLMTLSSPVAAQVFQNGLAAAQAGDFATALKEWTPLAEAGDVDAQYNLGIMYDNGYGVPQDYAEAVKWYRLAAEQGYAKAQYNLGTMYEYGNGVPQDYKEAVRWYRLAAEQGNVDAQYNLAIMYDNGKGVLQDDQEAIKWYRLAAEQGDVDAQNNLAVMYEYGNGVLQDNTMAHMWYNIASANGDDESGEWRDEIAKKMTTAAIEKAQAMARECMNGGYTKCGY